MASVRIIGTSHISKRSVREIIAAIESEKPDIVAVELDRTRLQSLQNKTERNRRPGISSIPVVGLQGYLFSLIGGWLQKKLGNIVGMEPGSDMLAAVETAAKKKIRVALIDQDIRVTLRRFSKSFGFREKINMVLDALKGLVLRKGLPFDIRSVPDDQVIEKLMEEVQRRYPGIYKALVEERNVFMAKALFSIISQNHDAHIIAVVGAGHKKGILEELQKIFKANKPIGS